MRLCGSCGRRNGLSSLSQWLHHKFPHDTTVERCRFFVRRFEPVLAVRASLALDVFLDERLRLGAPRRLNSMRRVRAGHRAHCAGSAKLPSQRQTSATTVWAAPALKTKQIVPVFPSPLHLLVWSVVCHPAVRATPAPVDRLLTNL